MDNERFAKQIDEIRKRELELRKSTQSPRDGAQQQSPSSPAMRYTWLGAEFAAIFIGFVWGGYTLDQRLATKPWLLLTGIALGFGLALYRLIFVAKRLGG